MKKSVMIGLVLSGLTSAAQAQTAPAYQLRRADVDGGQTVEQVRGLSISDGVVMATRWIDASHLHNGDEKLVMPLAPLDDEVEVDFLPWETSEVICLTPVGFGTSFPSSDWIIYPPRGIGDPLRLGLADASMALEWSVGVNIGINFVSDEGGAEGRIRPAVAVSDPNLPMLKVTQFAPAIQHGKLSVRNLAAGTTIMDAGEYPLHTLVGWEVKGSYRRGGFEFGGSVSGGSKK